MFEVGEGFGSYEELEEKIQLIRKENFIDLWKRDSRTITAAQKRLTKELNPKLKYYELTLACIHGGREFKSESQGKRSSKTLKNKCPFVVKLRASLNGQSLEVKNIINTHNHDIDQNLFRHLPKQRRLTQDEAENAAYLLELQVNKKKLQQELSKNGKVVTLRDLSNIAAKYKKQSQNDLKTLLDTLENKYG